jgi:CBS domain-containing membrane protein
MKRNESIKKIMSKDLVTGSINEKFSDVLSKMETNTVHHLPILSGKELIGMITSVDLMRSSFSNIFVSSDKATSESLDHTVKIENIMQKDLITIKHTATVRDAAEILAKHQFNSIPVIDDSSHLVGIVTSRDLIAYLLDQY